jgi:uncharacterized protein (DUF2249 family)
MATTEIDVRRLAPAQRHPLIFSHLGTLATGDTLRLVNDHDPKPLRYQLEAEHPGQFRWDPVEAGPSVWKVDITSKARVVDARPVIAAGGEPFDAIMRAADDVADDEILVVLSPFEPVPLQGVLAERGFQWVSDEIAPGDWRTTFLRMN